MLTMNHTATYYLAALRQFIKITKGDKGQAVEMADEYLQKNVAVLLLPDAIRMYGPRQQFHCTEHPNTHAISSVRFLTTPDKLRRIKNLYKANLQPGIPKCVIDEMSHPETFIAENPEWAESAYVTHLVQDYFWDKWIREKVDVTDRLLDKFVYKQTGEVVDGATLRKELGPLDNVFFQKIANAILEEFGVLLNEEWFEKNVHAVMLALYDEEIAENTWKYINLPSMEAEIELPAFICKHELDCAVENLIKATTMALFI